MVERVSWLSLTGGRSVVFKASGCFFSSSMNLSRLTSRRIIESNATNLPSGESRLALIMSAACAYAVSYHESLRGGKPRPYIRGKHGVNEMKRIACILKFVLRFSLFVRKVREGLDIDHVPEVAEAFSGFHCLLFQRSEGNFSKGRLALKQGFRP